jgi:hypothetical protein
MNALSQADVLNLSVSESIQLVADIWDTIAEISEEVRLTNGQKAKPFVTEGCKFILLKIKLVLFLENQQSPIDLGFHEKDHGLNLADNNFNAKTLVSGMSTMVFISLLTFSCLRPWYLLLQPRSKRLRPWSLPLH